MTDHAPVRTRDRFLVFGAPEVHEDDIAAVVRTLRSGWWGTGPRAQEFEEAFRAYKHASHSVALGSCTAALHLSLLAADLHEGDEVITTPLTFCATVNAIIHAGATPVLADVDPVTMNICPQAIRERWTQKTRAVVPVHFGGRSCDMDAIMNFAREKDLVVIEDCAHAIETTWRGQGAGTFGRFGCFSFYATKNVATGEGGMVVTPDEEAANRIRRLALHGMSKDAWKRYSDEGYKHYFVVDAGYKCNMMDLQAAIGLGQLARVERNHRRRQEIWNRYNAAFECLPVDLPAPTEAHSRHALHLYTLLIRESRAGVSRDEFLVRMTGEGIGTGVQYLAIPEHPHYQERFRWRPSDWPVATDIGRATVSLPISARLTDQDVEDVITAVLRSLKR